MERSCDGDPGFFESWGGERLIEAYFDQARFWGDLGAIMRLTPRALALHARHARRIADREHKARS